MILEIKVIPKSSRNLIKQEGARFKAYVTAPAQKGKANDALFKLLALHFRVKKKDISIIKGERSSLKVIKIENMICLPRLS
jgi:uncharacterized protein (TIGR00251 family)